MKEALSDAVFFDDWIEHMYTIRMNKAYFAHRLHTLCLAGRYLDMAHPIRREIGHTIVMAEEYLTEDELQEVLASQEHIWLDWVMVNKLKLLYLDTVTGAVVQSMQGGQENAAEEA